MDRPERGDAEGKDRILEPVALREFQMGENAAAEQKNNITAGEPQIAVALKAEKR